METLFGKNTEERCKGDLNFFRENIYLRYFTGIIVTKVQVHVPSAQ